MSELPAVCTSKAIKQFYVGEASVVLIVTD